MPRTITHGRRDRRAIAGSKAEILIEPVSGKTKPVFFGQRWPVVVQENQTTMCCLTAWHTEAEAKRYLLQVLARSKATTVGGTKRTAKYSKPCHQSPAGTSRGPLCRRS